MTAIYVAGWFMRWLEVYRGGVAHKAILRKFRQYAGQFGVEALNIRLDIEVEHVLVVVLTAAGRVVPGDLIPLFNRVAESVREHKTARGEVVRDVPSWTHDLTCTQERYLAAQLRLALPATTLQEVDWLVVAAAKTLRDMAAADVAARVREQ